MILNSREKILSALIGLSNDKVTEQTNLKLLNFEKFPFNLTYLYVFFKC